MASPLSPSLLPPFQLPPPPSQQPQLASPLSPRQLPPLWQQAQPRLLGAVLQAPVSDREWLSGFPELPPLVSWARDMVKQGRGEEILLRYDSVTLDDAAQARRLYS